MKLSVVISTLLFLSLLAACSTKPVLTRNEPVYLSPSAGLLVLCLPPYLVPSKTNGDIINNSLERQSAFDACSIRHTCLVEWHAAAAAAVAAKGEAAVPLPAKCGQFEK